MTEKSTIEVHAKEGSESLVVSCHGFNSSQQFGDTLPDSIQLFPPGRHTIVASAEGKPIDLELTIGPEVADVFQADLVRMLAKAAEGKGPRPFFDINHEDREASGWPLQVFWAGSDPKDGGVRAKLDWSAPGEEAIKGKAFRQFSPNFLLDKSKRKIVGTTTNMGGLVNRPAFKEIEPLFAKDGTNQNESTAMKKLLSILAKHGIPVTAECGDDDAADKADKFLTASAACSTKLSAAEGRATAAEGELVTVKAKLAEHESTREKYAVVIVQAKGVGESRIAAKDEATQKRWVKLIAADPENASLLESLAPQGEGLDKRIAVKGKDGKDAKSGDKPQGIDAHPLMVKAKEIATAEKISTDAALVKAADAHPDLYESYRAVVNGTAEQTHSAN